MESSTSSRKVILKSSDGEEFIVDVEAAKLCRTIRNMIEDNCAWDTIPADNVTGKVLAKVIEYCNKHAKADVESKDESKISEEESKKLEEERKKSEEELEKWDREFVDIDLAKLDELILAANYLDIKGLLDLTCKKVASMIIGKTPEEIRTAFNIENDFSPEEEEEVYRENEWVFE